MSKRSITQLVKDLLALIFTYFKDKWDSGLDLGVDDEEIETDE